MEQRLLSDLVCAFGYGGNVEWVRALIAAGVDLNAHDDFGRTELMMASEERVDVGRVRVLIQASADVNACDRYRQTALMYASRYGDVESVRALIEAGADVNARSESGATALILASRFGDIGRVRALIEAGANISPRDNEGKSALSIAMEEENIKIVAYLKVKEAMERLGLQESRNRSASVGVSGHGGHGAASSPPNFENDLPVSAPDIDSRIHSNVDSAADTPYQTHNEHAEIDSSHITLGRELGQGSYATVYEGMWHGVTIAVKRVRPPHGTSWSSANQDLFRQVFEDQVRPEVNIMSAIRHPFVVGCYGCCADPPSILLELCPRGSLGQMFQACREDASLCRLMTWRQRLCMLRQVASAMRYLHSRNVFHRDLRAMNVLVAQDMTTKVSDVGLSKFADQVSSRSAGTLGDGANPRWLAPELISEDGPFTRACDVYGFGTIVWEMMEWRLPWENMSSNRIVNAMVRGHTLEVAGQERWTSLPGPAPKHTGTLPKISCLAQRCLSMDPYARPSFEDIVEILLGLEERETQGELASNVASRSQGAQNGGNCADTLNRLAVYCVEAGTDVNVVDDHGKTALMAASEFGDVTRVRALVEAGTKSPNQRLANGTSLVTNDLHTDVTSPSPPLTFKSLSPQNSSKKDAAIRIAMDSIQKNEEDALWIQLNSCGMDDGDVDKLCAALKNNTYVLSLDVSGNVITDTGIVALCDCLKERGATDLIELNVKNQQLSLGDEGIEALRGMMDVRRVIKVEWLSNRVADHQPEDVRDGILAALPVLKREDYFMKPSMTQLLAMAREDLRLLGSVSNFTVGRDGVGSVRWLDDVDVRGSDLDSIVSLVKGCIEVYPDSSVKPPVGQGLNCPAVVSMLKVFKTDKATGEPTKDPEVVEKFTRKLKRICAEQGAKFMSYDGKTGEWQFEVEHFSRYGLGGTSDVKEDVREGKGSAELPFACREEESIGW